MAHRKGNSSNGVHSRKSRAGNADGHVIDFAQEREKRLEQKVRQNERVVFGNLMSVYSVGEDSSIHPIEIIEVSEKGLSFQIPATREEPWHTSENEIPVRMYFSQDTYLEILVRTKYARPSIENGEKFVRYGCALDTSTQSFPAYQLFVQFLKQYAMQSHRDMGKVSAFYR